MLGPHKTNPLRKRNKVAHMVVLESLMSERSKPSNQSSLKVKVHSNVSAVQETRTSETINTQRALSTKRRSEVRQQKYQQRLVRASSIDSIRQSDNEHDAKVLQACDMFNSGIVTSSQVDISKPLSQSSGRRQRKNSQSSCPRKRRSKA